MPATDSSLKQFALRETALFLGLLFFGFVLMPVGIYLVGRMVFGSYGGHGYGEFFGTLSGKIRNGELVAWILVLSPYLAWLIVRIARLAWRSVGRSHSQE